MKGLDNKGANMPSYAMSEYGADKYARNPSNRGHWDLYNTGQYYMGITVRFKPAKVEFYQKYKNNKIEWLDRRLEIFDGSIRSLGITEKQLFTVQKDLIPIIYPKLAEIIKGK